jgi:crossover junction endodeoxyribonuclease RuvC
MKVLGIDPGTGRMGWAVCDVTKNTGVMIDYGCLETPAHTPQEKRLVFIYESLKKIIKKYKPEVASIEDLFFAQNVSTAMTVSQARGVVLLLLEQNKIPCTVFKPSEIKMAVGGNGRADKKQMQFMVKLLLKLKEIPQPDDAADALAACITYGAYKG